MRDQYGNVGAVGGYTKTADGRFFKRHRRDRNKYALPHQGSRERARRVRQAEQHAIKRFLES